MEAKANRADPAQQIADIWAKMMTRREFALKGVPNRPVSERTVIRWEQAGMPVIRLGHVVRLYDPVACSAWLLSHERRKEAPARGRPITKRAA